MRQFLHVGFNLPANKAIPRDEIQKVLDGMGGDWLRYAPNAWIVWTSDSPEQLYQRLLPFTGRPNELVLILRVNPDGRYGWMPKSVWDWFKKERSKY